MLNAFKILVKYLFEVDVAEHQRKLIAAGQPKTLRLKNSGIRHFVPCTSMLPVLGENTADAIQKALLHMRGTFTKADNTLWQKGELKKPIGDLSLKGPPRRHVAPKWSKVVIEHPPVHVIIHDGTEAELNTERWLLCPKCSKGQETAGKALLNGPGDPNGTYAFLYCKTCKKQSKTGAWICQCLMR